MLEERERVPGRDVLAQHHDAGLREVLPIQAAAWIPSFVPVGGIRMSVTTTSSSAPRPSASSCGRSPAHPGELEVLAKAKRGSNRRGKVKATVARLKARERDRRKDWVEKTSTDIARRFDVIRVETSTSGP